MLFACQSERKEQRDVFPSSQPGTTDRDVRGLTLIRIFTVCWRLSVSPRILRALEPVGCASGSHSGHEIEEEEKFFSSTLYRERSGETPFL